ncbi:hypothetical protein HZA98_03045, partial [Candidatus Woesearchaeota archaeon]|nr:hypothetical protein [Candidatus Woesearchaeota archaeon]
SGGGEGSGGSSSSGGGGGGGSSGGGGDGGGSASSARTLLDAATGDAVAENTSPSDLAGNTSVSSGEDSSALPAVTGASIFDTISHFGKGKALIVILLLAILAYFLYRKLKKGKKVVVDTKAEITPTTSEQV